MPELRVHIRTHHFVIRDIQIRARAAIMAFRGRYIQYGRLSTPGGGNTKVKLHTFGTATSDWSELRFHINQLEPFKQTLKQYGIIDTMVEFIKTPRFAPVKVELPIFPKWQPFEYQLPVLAFMNGTPPPPFPQDYTAAKLVSAQTGKGKSYMGMNSISHHGFRTWISIKPMYIEKWKGDLKKTFDIDDDDVLVIQGGESLMELLDDAVNNRIKAKVIITSNKTFQNYIKLYELFGPKLAEHGYPVPPDEFCEACGIGHRLIDEVHQDFHLNFKLDLYTHCPTSNSLSATLTSYDAFLSSMYEVAYPYTVRAPEMEYHKYVSARGLIWGLQSPEKVRYKNGGNYSHNVFEQSILKYKGMTGNYLQMMKITIDTDFIPDRREGDRLLIFCASIDMCTIVTEYLKREYPQFDVRRYVQEDPYENAMEPDIIVSTMLSAGTALDIPNLRMVFMTTCMSSKQGNIQGLGRLRFIPDVKLRFVYTACENIAKQMAYHEEKKMLLRDRALYYRTDYYRTPV